MFVYNKTGEEFQIGDLVFIANTVVHTDTCYAAEVVAIVSDHESKGMGVHYVLYAPTHIDDHLTVREAARCFRTTEQYQTVCKEAKAANDAFKKKLREFRL